MSSTQHHIAVQAQRLIPLVAELYERALTLEKNYGEALQKVDAAYRDSARNLLHYLAVRQVDIRQLQTGLASLGLSSLGRMEAHTLNTLNAVLFALHRITNQNWAPDAKSLVDFNTGEMLLNRHAENLLGLPAGKRSVRIMVTMPSEAATNSALMREMLAAGMDVMRINCAHDNPDTWAAMATNLRQAPPELGRSCRILTDLGGPKLRTGAIKSAGRILRIKPTRDVRGRVVTPAQVWLVPAEIPQDGPGGAMTTLLMPRELLQKSMPGDELRFRDTRDKQRVLRIVSCAAESRLAEISKTAYIEDGLAVTLNRRDEQLGAARFSDLPDVMAPLQLTVGDQLLLTRGAEPGQPAIRDYNGQVIKPARISCALKEAFDAVKPGASVWFDDGKIGGTALKNNGEIITVQITHTNLKGGRLRAEKGINLPDTDMSIPALTSEDLEDLEFVVQYADMIGLSFVRTPEDVFLLQEQLARLGAKRIGVILKIETRKAFDNLPQLLLAGLCAPPVGVMVARGDLGVEVGFERLAEVQEEILWLCEAAHAPVIWATQVLEGMATKGSPSRAEVSDAVMSGRAECVMLNKGPYIVETVRFLNGLLRRMDAQQSKRRAMMRRLSVSEMR